MIPSASVNSTCRHDFPSGSIFRNVPSSSFRVSPFP